GRSAPPGPAACAAPRAATTAPGGPPLRRPWAGAGPSASARVRPVTGAGPRRAGPRVLALPRRGGLAAVGLGLRRLLRGRGELLGALARVRVLACGVPACGGL